MAPTISASQLHAELTTSPSAVLDFILTNNWQAVADNLQGAGMERPISQQQTAQVITWLYNSGHYNEAAQALSVPMRTDQMLPEQIAEALNVNRQWQGNPSVMNRWQIGEAEVGADDIMSGLAVGWLAMLQQANQTTTTTPGSTGAAPAPGAQQPPAATNSGNLIWWVVGAAVVLVAGFFIIKALRKK